MVALYIWTEQLGGASEWAWPFNFQVGEYCFFPLHRVAYEFTYLYCEKYWSLCSQEDLMKLLEGIYFFYLAAILKLNPCKNYMPFIENSQDITDNTFWKIRGYPKKSFVIKKKMYIQNRS